MIVTTVFYKEDFKEIGVTSLGDRKRLQWLVQSLRSTPDSTGTEMPDYQQASLDEDITSLPAIAYWETSGSTAPTTQIGYVCGLDVYDTTN